MEKPVAVLLLTLGGFVAAAILLATVFPSVISTGNAIAADRASISEQSLQEIAVVNSLSELDGTGTWQDTDSDTYFDVWMWVKNTGSVTIGDVTDIDIFVHGAGTSTRIPHSDDTASYPQWSASVVGGDTWLEGSTLAITIHYSSAVSAGTYGMEALTSQGAGSLRFFEF
jgi:archaellum component FlaG (FlaF/FlaG flagellin family)